MLPSETWHSESHDVPKLREASITCHFGLPGWRGAAHPFLTSFVCHACYPLKLQSRYRDILPQPSRLLHLWPNLCSPGTDEDSRLKPSKDLPRTATTYLQRTYAHLFGKNSYFFPRNARPFEVYRQLPVARWSSGYILALTCYAEMRINLPLQFFFCLWGSSVQGKKLFDGKPGMTYGFGQTANPKAKIETFGIPV